MRKHLMSVSLIAGLIAPCPAVARAQWVVHALVGTVESVKPSTGTINIVTHNGSRLQFSTRTKSDVKLEFDRDVRAESTSSQAFRTRGAHVVVYYYGIGEARTAVAIQNLGSGPFICTQGTVVTFDRHNHLLTIQTDKGDKESFNVGDKAVVDLPEGVKVGHGFDPENGDHVRVMAAPGKDGEQALFIRDI